MAELPDLKLGALEPEDVQAQLSSVIKQLNEWARELSNENFVKIVKSDSGIETLMMGRLPSGGNGMLITDSSDVPRLIAGEDQNGNIIIKLSQASNDVTTASDDKLIFSSDFNMFKVTKIVNVTQSISHTVSTPSYQEDDVAHGLDIEPAFVAFIKLDPVLQALSGGEVNHANPAMVHINQSGLVVLLALLEVYVDDTNVTLLGNLGGGVNSGTYVNTAKVYLLQETQ
jgi:hypothetical protein